MTVDRFPDKTEPMRKSLLCLALVFFLVSGHAHGQANLTFSGGNGSPLSITLLQPVVFTINIAGPQTGPIFVFQGAGNPFAGASFAATGNISYSVNGAGNQALTGFGSGITTGNISPNDIFANGALGSLNLGDTIRLNAGTLTTSSNVAAAPPASGSFTTFVANNSGVRISTFGAPVPEPRSSVLLLIGGLGLLVMIQRVRRTRFSR